MSRNERVANRQCKNSGRTISKRGKAAHLLQAHWERSDLCAGSRSWRRYCGVQKLGANNLPARKGDTSDAGALGAERPMRRRQIVAPILRGAKIRGEQFTGRKGDTSDAGALGAERPMRRRQIVAPILRGKSRAGWWVVFRVGLWVVFWVGLWVVFWGGFMGGFKGWVLGVVCLSRCVKYGGRL